VANRRKEAAETSLLAIEGIPSRFLQRHEIDNVSSDLFSAPRAEGVIFEASMPKAPVRVL
jgi:hypothetical protein